MSIGTLIVGLGQIGMGYDVERARDSCVRSHARAFGSHPAFHLVGGVDPQARHRVRFEREYRSRAFSELDAALLEVAPELVVIAVPTSDHGVVLRTVFERSQPKAILCEKPLSYDLHEARKMVRVCADRGARLFVNYIRRSDPGVLEVKRRLDSGEIVTPLKGVVWYSKGLLHSGSHLFNLMEFWLGPMADAQMLATGRLWDKGDPEPDFTARFERGTVVFLAAREEEFSHHTAELMARNGRLRYEQGGRKIFWQSAVSNPELKDSSTLADASEPIESGMDRYQWHVADQVAAALVAREASFCDGDSALSTLDALTRIIQQR